MLFFCKRKIKMSVPCYVMLWQYVMHETSTNYDNDTQ